MQVIILTFVSKALTIVLNIVFKNIVVREFATMHANLIIIIKIKRQIKEKLKLKIIKIDKI